MMLLLLMLFLMKRLRGSLRFKRLWKPRLPLLRLSVGRKGGLGLMKILLLEHPIVGIAGTVATGRQRSALANDAGGPWAQWLLRRLGVSLLLLWLLIIAPLANKPMLLAVGIPRIGCCGRGHVAISSCCAVAHVHVLLLLLLYPHTTGLSHAAQ